MNSTITPISLTDLAIAFIPVLFGLYLLFRWSLNVKQASYALLRMLSQLLMIGYVLSYIFYSDNAWLISTILLMMVLISSWIALDSIKDNRLPLLKGAIVAITIGGGATLILMTQGVLKLDPWYQPKILIPLAGMIFANAMNSVSLSAERLMSELNNNNTYQVARNQALNAATIPMINSLLAVGLVSLPGMMTGQILSGVSPLIAARYQILVMCMIFSSSIISAFIFLVMAQKTTLIQKPKP
ncbi:ABC transporter permease [Thalassotalea sp. PLHSN55]|uniref:ABC transporter permease n=1 Tax=Thalassotalea sp. PLHSN55 TaxID=3435888 RepID=UPI003F85DE16